MEEEKEEKEGRRAFQVSYFDSRLSIGKYFAIYLDAAVVNIARRPKQKESSILRNCFNYELPVGGDIYFHPSRESHWLVEAKQRPECRIAIFKLVILSPLESVYTVLFLSS